MGQVGRLMDIDLSARHHTCISSSRWSTRLVARPPRVGRQIGRRGSVADLWSRLAKLGQARPEGKDSLVVKVCRIG